jgi:hypothetical protein
MTYVNDMCPPKPAFLAASSDTAWYCRSLSILRWPYKFGGMLFLADCQVESAFFILAGQRKSPDLSARVWRQETGPAA